jgi:purine nucleosidase
MKALLVAALITTALVVPARAQRRLIILDQDGSGPGGSNMMSMMALLQSPQA